MSISCLVLRYEHTIATLECPVCNTAFDIDLRRKCIAKAREPLPTERKCNCNYFDMYDPYESIRFEPINGRLIAFISAKDREKASEKLDTYLAEELYEFVRDEVQNCSESERRTIYRALYTLFRRAKKADKDSGGDIDIPSMEDIEDSIERETEDGLYEMASEYVKKITNTEKTPGSRRVVEAIKDKIHFLKRTRDSIKLNAELRKIQENEREAEMNNKSNVEQLSTRKIRDIRKLKSLTDWSNREIAVIYKTNTETVRRALVTENYRMRP